jgi:hypothetical protein
MKVVVQVVQTVKCKKKEGLKLKRAVLWALVMGPDFKTRIALEVLKTTFGRRSSQSYNKAMLSLRNSLKSQNLSQSTNCMAVVEMIITLTMR